MDIKQETIIEVIKKLELKSQEYSTNATDCFKNGEMNTAQNKSGVSQGVDLAIKELKDLIK